MTNKTAIQVIKTIIQFLLENKPFRPLPSNYMKHQSARFEILKVAKSVPLPPPSSLPTYNCTNLHHKDSDLAQGYANESLRFSKQIRGFLSHYLNKQCQQLILLPSLKTISFMKS